MKSLMAVGIAIGVVLASTVVAVAGRAFVERRPAFAEVVTSDPVFESKRVPQQTCRDVVVAERQEPRDRHRIAGTAIGAVLGGVVGHQIGDGDGQKIATVAGAAAGGYAGNRVQRRLQDRNVVQTTQRKCWTDYQTTRRQVGYDVRYRIDDTVSTVRLERDPGIGARYPIVDGAVDFNARRDAKGPETI